ncbi:hypothetical protein [Candidatus Cetobacterium colombiensis]|uniref:Flagellar assembly protein T C-terminal domain-containing protein n=1 Tax=Candidatus Cetobacterium colombiensis TaxID=3073100 RepID=A0ABU4W6P1_9FUSO|nr:hypothetical protein [Candidatus Cetobacterium colombiensis]MDX8335201.1 hypothetical protein [Candidatus Cetobacterium colombiensis]
MKKTILIFLLASIGNVTFSEIKVKIVEPMRFTNINTTHLDKDKVLGKGIIEVFTDNKEEDIGKKIMFEFPEYNLMTNRRKWLKVEKLGMESSKKEMIVTKEREHIPFYAVLDRKNINDGEVIDVEGEYVGYIPIVVSQYVKKGSEKNK